MVLTLVIDVLIKKNMQTHTGEGHMMTEAETGVMLP